MGRNSTYDKDFFVSSNQAVLIIETVFRLEWVLMIKRREHLSKNL